MSAYDATGISAYATFTDTSHPICGVCIRYAPDSGRGRYCLNDLHKASGGAEKDKPIYFLKLQQTAELVDALSKDSNFDPVQSIRGGKTPGTYVVKELVYAYAMWISATFQLKLGPCFASLIGAPVGTKAGEPQPTAAHHLHHLSGPKADRWRPIAPV